jgi:CxxC-x17-CxxC domain-containing protein
MEVRRVYTDKSLSCADCGATFTFTAGEQEFHASKGFTNEPRRCPSCRTARRSNRDGGGGGGRSGGFGGGGGQRREMYDVQCAQCGKMTQVPFNPRGDRPVYCSDCYRSSNSYSGSRGGGGGSRGGRW